MTGKNYIQVLLLFIITSCSSRNELNPQELVDWYSKNQSSYQFFKEINGVKYSLNLIPESVIIANKILNGTYRKDSIIGNNLLFVFRISNTDGSSLLYKGIHNQNEYFERINYYSFNIQQDFMLYNKEDTVTCSGAHFERTYELTPHVTINVDINANEFLDKKNFTFEYTDRVFNSGKVKILIPSKKIVKFPKLKP